MKTSQKIIMETEIKPTSATVSSKRFVNDDYEYLINCNDLIATCQVSDIFFRQIDSGEREMKSQTVQTIQPRRTTTN